MARPKEFDRDEALERAMELFWEKGYECTSMQDLVDGMGIGRASLYDTFGSKHELFCEVVDRYRRHAFETVLGPIRSAPSPRKAIEELFRGLVHDQCDGKSASCLMVKCAVTTGRRDPATAERVTEHLQEMEALFHDTLRRARELGEIDADKNLRALARFLTSTVQGLVVSATARRDPRALGDVVRTALSVLD